MTTLGDPQRVRSDGAAIELGDIQAALLRSRPEPYYGTHVLGRIEEARAGRELL